MLRALFCFFFFKQKTAYEMRISDWSSDVCSSDLDGDQIGFEHTRHGGSHSFASSVEKTFLLRPAEKEPPETQSDEIGDDHRQHGLEDQWSAGGDIALVRPLHVRNAFGFADNIVEPSIGRAHV